MAIALGGMLITGVLTYSRASSLVLDIIHEQFNERLRAIDPIVQITHEENLDRQKLVAERLLDQVGQRLTVDFGSAVNQEVENQETHEKTTLAVPIVRVDGRILSTHELVDQIRRETGSEVTIMSLLPEGLLRVSTSIRKADGSRAIGTYVPSTSPVYAAIRAGQPFLGRIKVVGQQFVTAYVPLKQNGQVVGALFAGNPETSYERIISYLKTLKLLSNGYFYILDSSGTMIMHPSLVGQNMLEKTDLDGNRIFSDIINRKDGWIEYRWPTADGKGQTKKMAVFHYLPLMDWYIAASVSLDEAYAKVASLRAIILSSTALVMILMGICIWLIANHFSKLLVAMADRFKSNSERVIHQSTSVLEVSEKLSTSSAQQAAAIQETAAALEEVSATVEKNLESTETSERLSVQSAEASQMSADVMNRISSAVAEVQDGNNRVLGEINQSYQEIRAITDVLNTISEKTTVINDIVLQTKLLAFNASVEAARAGEHGKGFSVVAEEINHLAAKVGVTASDIDSTISESLTKVADLIADAEKRIQGSFQSVRGQIDRSVSVADEGRAALEQLLENARRVQAAIQEIARGSREQAHAISEISTAIRQIDSATVQNAELAQTATEVSQALEEEAESLSGTTEDLETVVKGRAPAGLSVRAQDGSHHSHRTSGLSRAA